MLKAFPDNGSVTDLFSFFFPVHKEIKKKKKKKKYKNKKKKKKGAPN